MEWYLFEKNIPGRWILVLKIAPEIWRDWVGEGSRVKLRGWYSYGIFNLQLLRFEISVPAVIEASFISF